MVALRGQNKILVPTHDYVDETGEVALSERGADDLGPEQQLDLIRKHLAGRPGVTSDTFAPAMVAEFTGSVWRGTR